MRGLDRRNPVRALGAAGLAAAAVPAARRALRERARRGACSAAAATSPGPPALAALSLRLPLVLTEADSHLGLSNRLLARARPPRLPRLPDRGPRRGALPGHRAARCRPRSARADRDAARERFGIAAADRCLLVFGGSQGARSINLGALDAFAAPRRPRATSTSCTSPASATTPRPASASRRPARSPRYTLLAYEPDLGDALAASDLVLARAGGSIFEIAAAGRPAILVPYPYAAARHQHANAAGWPRRGRRSWSRTPSSNPARLRELAGGLLGDERAPGRDGGGVRARAPAPTPRGGSPRSCWPRSGRLDGDERRRLVSTQASLHRHRRRGHERPGARLPRGSGPGSAAAIVPRAPTSAASVAAGIDARLGHDPDAVPAGCRGGRLDRDRRRQPRARAGARAGPAGRPSRRAARRALRAEAPDRDRRRARQDDDGGDARLADGRRAAPSSSAASCPGFGPDGDAGERRLGSGRRVGDRRGGRVGRQLPRARARDRGGHQRRARPSLALVVARASCSRRFGDSPSPPPASCCSPTRRSTRSRPDSGSCASTASSPGPPLRLRVPGAHNVLNARAALAAAELAGVGPAAQLAAAARGASRGCCAASSAAAARAGAEIYDDYAHHPTEVAATLEALRELEPRRLIAVFQPHLYSRTKALAGRFGAALAGADAVGVLDVYAAREEPVGELAGVSGLDVARATADRARGRPVWWLRDAETARRAARRRAAARATCW